MCDAVYKMVAKIVSWCSSCRWYSGFPVRFMCWRWGFTIGPLNLLHSTRSSFDNVSWKPSVCSACTPTGTWSSSSASAFFQRFFDDVLGDSLASGLAMSHDHIATSSWRVSLTSARSCFSAAASASSSLIVSATSFAL